MNGTSNSFVTFKRPQKEIYQKNKSAYLKPIKHRISEVRVNKWKNMISIIKWLKNINKGF